MSDYLHFLIAAAKHCDPQVRPMPVSYMTGKSPSEIIEALHDYYGEKHMDKARDLLRKNYPRFFPEIHHRSVREDLPLSGAREPSQVT